MFFKLVAEIGTVFGLDLAGEHIQAVARADADSGRPAHFQLFDGVIHILCRCKLYFFYFVREKRLIKNIELASVIVKSDVV